MTEWFCKKCNSVFHKKVGECCGEVEPFDVIKHGRILISRSNAWISVWDKWKYEPLIKKISSEHAKYGNSSAPRILNDFIEYLKEKNK